MRIFVTGGAGFIGSGIANRLASEGNEVSVLDDLSNGNMENLNQNISFVKGDIRDFVILDKAMKNIDYVFHEAAEISVAKSMKEPTETFSVNTLGTVNVLNSAMKNNVKKVIFASSAAVYGKNPILPKKEEMLPEPKSPYAVTKLDGEYLMKMFYEEYGLRTSCLRYFNVYGPRQRHDSPYAAAIPLFIDNAAKNADITVYGDGSQTRDFIHVDDVVQANLLMMKKGDGEIFNVASGKKITINEIVNMIIKLSGSKSKIIYKPERAGDIKDSLADISKIGKIGFKPSVSIESGVRELLTRIKSDS